MMSKFNYLKLSGFLILSTIVLLANSSNPPNGRTGAPGDSVCSTSGCHGTGMNGLDGDINISGLPGSVSPNTTYPLTVTVNNPNGMGVKAGFQWVALNSTNTNIGTMSNPSANTTITSFNGKMYHEHQPAQNFGGSNSVSYNVDWTSPAGPNNESITLYAAGVIGNGNSSRTGDFVVFNQTTATLVGGITPLSVTTSLINDVTCNGGTNGSATANPSGGTPGYTYMWDNGETGMTAINLNAGMHTVIVTDAAMVSETATVFINEPSAIGISLINVDDENCTAQDGSIEVLASGGASGVYNYMWNNGTSGSILSGLSSGMYTVMVTDLDNCSESLMVTVGNDPGNLTVDLVASNDPLCEGDTNGSIEVSGLNGSGTYDYAWSNMVNTAFNPDLGSGTYTVTVTDSFGCEQTAMYSLTNPAPISISEIFNNPEICEGQNGNASVSASGGTGILNYLWSDGTTGPSNSNLETGTYTVYVSDANFCNDSLSVVIQNDPSNLDISLDTITDLSCHQSLDGIIEVLPNGGAAPFEFDWSNGDSTSIINGLDTGLYILTLTDANSCISVDSFVISQPQQFLASTFVENISCFGDQNGQIEILPSGNFPPFTYQWSTGDSTSIITDLAEGYYSVEIFDSTNCSIILDSIFVNEPDSFFLTPYIVTLPGCSGQSFGTITALTNGGTAPFSYDWAIGFTQDTINVTPGFYPVTVTDANDCVDSTFINMTVTDIDPPNLNVMDFDLYVDEMGQTPPIDTSMFDLGSTDNCDLLGFVFDESPLNCSQDSFLLPIELSDINGNTSFDTLVVSIIDTIAPQITCAEDYIVSTCDSFIYDLPLASDNCNVELFKLAGPAPGDVLELGPNLIRYLAFDESGNTNSCSFTITLEPSLTSETITSDVSCFNFQDGSVEIIANSDHLPIEIIGLDFDNTEFLEAGTYHFELIDSSGCSLIDSFTINEPEVLLITDFDIIDATNSNSMDGSIDITVSGGNPSYSYEWFFNGVSFSMAEDLTNLSPGEYECIVTDSTDCTYNSIVFVVDAITSIEELTLEASLEIFPNPARNHITVSYDHNEHQVNKYQILDSRGKSILELVKPNQNQSIDINFLSNGIYFLKAEIDGICVYKKIIIFK